MSGNYIYSSSSYGLGTISGAVSGWQKKSETTVTASSYQEILQMLKKVNAPAAEQAETGTVDTKSMSMNEYKAYITEQISEIPFDETRPNDEEFIQISDAGWEAMKEDPSYETWVLDKIRSTRSTSDGYYSLGGSGSYTMESFGASREDYRVQSWSKDLGEDYDRLKLQQTAADMFWMSIGATEKQKEKMAKAVQEQQMKVLQGNLRNTMQKALNASTGITESLSVKTQNAASAEFMLKMLSNM